MSFKVEDGTGLSDSTSYASLAEATAYVADQGLTWTGADAAKQILLMRATTYIDRTYIGRIKSEKLLTTQALQFPRGYLTDEDGNYISGIPNRLKYATIEAACELLAGTTLEPSLDRSGMISSTSVGPVSVSYEPGAPVDTIYPKIENYLSPYLKNGTKLERV